MPLRVTKVPQTWTDSSPGSTGARVLPTYRTKKIRPDKRRGSWRTFFYHNKLSYIIDGREGVYRRNKVHLCPTTPEVSLEKTPPPAA